MLKETEIEKTCLFRHIVLLMTLRSGEGARAPPGYAYEIYTDKNMNFERQVNIKVLLTWQFVIVKKNIKTKCTCLDCL